MKNSLFNKQETGIPSSLKITQEWFASVITERLEQDNTIQEYSTSGVTMEEEASRYIAASAALKPHQRMQIYNQQYWWRLLNKLHVNFPLVTRLFGYQAFNEKIGIPYLLRYPPNHWSLTLLGEHLPQWVTEYYKEADRSLISHAAQLDRAFTASSIAAQYPPLGLYQKSQEAIERIISTALLYLQPHLHLFSWKYHLFAFREEFLKHDVDYWTEHRFPKLQKGKSYHFILYRNVNHLIAWREISLAAFLLLEQFKAGTTIEAACEYVERKGAVLCEEAMAHLQEWLSDWTQAGWLTECCAS